MLGLGLAACAPGPLDADPPAAFVALGHDGSNHYSGQVVAAHDELVVMGGSDTMVLGWDDAVVADIQTEIAALDAAVGD